MAFPREPKSCPNFKTWLDNSIGKVMTSDGRWAIHTTHSPTKNTQRSLRGTSDTDADADE